MSIQRLKSYSKDFTISERIKPRFTGIFIPSEVLEIEDISLMEMLLISWIDALYDKEHGGCFASNAYLSEKLKVKENSIAKSLTNLRKFFLIEDVSFDGRKRVIRSKLASYIEFCQSSAGLEKNPMLDWKKIQAGLEKNPMLHNARPIYDSKAKEKKREGVPPKPPALPFSSKLIEREKHVSTSEDEHQKLTKELGESRTKECYTKLSEWKLDTPKSKWKKSDYRSIKRWVITSLDERKTKSSGSEELKISRYKEALKFKSFIETSGCYKLTKEGIMCLRSNSLMSYSDDDYARKYLELEGKGWI